MNPEETNRMAAKLLVDQMGHLDGASGGASQAMRHLLTAMQTGALQVKINDVKAELDELNQPTPEDLAYVKASVESTYDSQEPSA